MPHNWITVRLGRICSQCNLVEANGEFTPDDAPCPRDRPHSSPPPSRDDEPEEREEEEPPASR